MKDKILGMFYGIAIGDGLGIPVETWSKEKISKKYGRIEKFEIPVDHIWFEGKPAGTISDDTFLSFAVAEGLIESDLDMDSQVKHHIKALGNDGNLGWGRSTLESIKRLANGVHWSESGTGGDGTGIGNGVAMKVAPIGAYASVHPDLLERVIEFTKVLGAMTHRTSISASAALAQVFAIKYCLDCKNINDFNVNNFAKIVLSASSFGRYVFTETISDDITARFELLFNNIDKFNPDKLISDFGCGTCYCYNSLPFSYGFFLNNYKKIDCLYDVVSAGGDTDTNGSIVGSLLGSLHGDSIFPQHLKDGILINKDIISLSERFCDFLGIQ